MSKSYTVQPGDTFESIARKAYGNAQYSGDISAANPGTVEPLTPGADLVVPGIPGAPSLPAGQSAAESDNDVAVLIDGVRFRFWSELRVHRSLDGFDVIDLSAPFEPDAPGFKETFRPFSFKPLVVTVGGVPLFTGTVVGINPVMDADTRTVSVSAYSTAGVLQDCTPPASSYPCEFDFMALPEIAAALCRPFGIPVQFTAPGGAIFDRDGLSPTADVASFLSDLARQRNLVMSSTPEGGVVFQRSVDPGKPVAVLQQGASPVISVAATFSPQQYYSSVTGLEDVFLGTLGSQYTVKNKHLPGIVRPHTFQAPDVIGGDIKDAVEAKIGRMFGNMASYTVSVSTWRDPQGDLWRPNTTVKLMAPGAMIYSSYEFIVRSVSYARNAESEGAELELVLPGAFSGKVPEVLPWD